jgi:hypothetical protein
VRRRGCRSGRRRGRAGRRLRMGAARDRERCRGAGRGRARDGGWTGGRGGCEEWWSQCARGWRGRRDWLPDSVHPCGSAWCPPESPGKESDRGQHSGWPRECKGISGESKEVARAGGRYRKETTERRRGEAMELHVRPMRLGGSGRQDREDEPGGECGGESERDPGEDEGDPGVGGLGGGEVAGAAVAQG